MTEGFSTNRHQTSHGKSIKAVIRVSCLVFRENLGIRAGPEGTPRRAPGYSCVSGLVFLENRWRGLACISHHPTVEAREKRPVIRVS